MPDTAAPEPFLKQLTAMTAHRPTSPRAFIQANAAVILAALRAGHSGIDIHRAFIAAGHPPPMSLRQFRRYLARLRARESTPVPAEVTGAPAASRGPAPSPARPAPAPSSFRWDPLADDEDIQ